MSNPEFEQIARKIDALTNKTVANGCTEEEAIVAARMLRELLDKYNLTLPEVRDAVSAKKWAKTARLDLFLFDNESDFEGHKLLFLAICEFFDCVAISLPGKAHLVLKVPKSENTSHGMMMYGEPAANHSAMSLFKTLRNGLKTSFKIYWSFLPRPRKNRKASFQSYATGFSYRIDQRLTQMRESSVENSTNALVVLKTDALKSNLQDMGIKLENRAIDAPRTDNHQIHGWVEGGRATITPLVEA